jgi:hypothetical protein
MPDITIILLLTIQTICVMGGVMTGWYLRGRCFNMAGEVLAPSTRVVAYDNSDQDDQPGSVESELDAELSTILSEKEQNEIEWAREQGFLETDEDEGPSTNIKRILHGPIG